MKKSVQTPLSEQHNALKLYFDALLFDAGESSLDNPADSVEQHQSRPLVEVTEQCIDATNANIKTETETESDEVSADDSNIISASALVVSDESDKDEDDVEVVPCWAISRFQVLSFSLAGNFCSVSINMIAGIIPTPSHLTYLPGQAPWLIGLHRSKGAVIRVVDLAMVIDQADNELDIRSGADIPVGYIVLMGDGRWGFIIKTLDKMLPIENHQVKWKIKRSPSDIVIATIPSNMSTLLDIDAAYRYFSGKSCS